MDEEHFTTDGADQHTDPHRDPQSPTPTRQPRKLPIHLLERSYSPPGDRSARSIQEEVFAALAADIEKHGLLHPLAVRPAKIIRGCTEVDGWKIIDGHNRWEAALRLGWKEIDCVVYEGGELVLLGAGFGRVVFGYDVIRNKKAVARLRQAVADINEAHSNAIDAIATIGNSLIAARAILAKTGEFTFWVTAEFNWTLRTAQRYMAAAKFLEGKATCMSLLPAHLIYRISAPSADPDIVQDVVEAADAGTPLAPKEIEDRLDAAVQRRQREPRRDTAHVEAFDKVKPGAVLWSKAAKAGMRLRRQSVPTLARRLNPVETEPQLTIAHDAADLDTSLSGHSEDAPAPTTMSIPMVQLEPARQSSLVPLAARVIAALGEDLLRQVREALDHPDDRWDLIRLLRHGLAPGGAP
jgi:hypothetical protein